MSFDKLGLSDKVLSAVKAAGFEDPTPIQEKAIPFALQGRDILGVAQTGTGKTAAFTLPMLNRLEKGRARARMPRTLIVEPTRELAAQVAEAFEILGKNHKLTVALLIGGVSFEDQNKKLDRGADVLIATPGRLLDHFERGALLMNGVEILVIDEADRMLDMGFIPDVERICKLIPFTRQTLFFSATMPPEIQRLTDTFLQNPERIEAGKPSAAAETVHQVMVRSRPEPKAKREVLRNLLRTQENLTNGIIFCNRKRDVSIVHRSLSKHGFNAGCLHGDMDQRSRMATLDSFREGEIVLLVASDVAARGLDIPLVSHVLNYDVPTHAEDYVHRIGRTGRAGREGDAITIVTGAEKKYLDGIEALTGNKIAELDGMSKTEASDSKPEKDKKGAPAQSRKNEGRGKPRGNKQEKSADSEDKKSNVASFPSDQDSEKQKKKRSTAENKSENQKKQDSSRSKQKDVVVFGMSDHVPEFLSRPIRRRGK